LVLHAVLQLPQWVGVVSDVLHPSLTIPSQLATPAGQLTSEQAPLEQLSFAPPTVLHGKPHPLQLFESVSMSTSQPFDGLWSQSA